MAGKGGYRPNSGRPSLLDEQVRARVIEKAWDLIEKYFDDDTKDIEKKLEVAKHLAGKALPQNLNLAGELTNNVFIHNAISKSKEVA